MEFEQVGGSVTFVKPTAMQVGDYVEGVFTETTVDPKFKTLRHSFRQDDGTIKMVNGTGQLNHILKNIAPGTYLKVVYDGKKKLTSGNFKGTEANQWKVFKARGSAKDSPTSPSSSQEVGAHIADQIREKRSLENGVSNTGKSSDFYDDGEVVPF